MGGTAKKRRRNLVVSRKPKKHRVILVRNAVKNEEVRKVYDKDLTPKENLIKMGLDPNPNSLHEIRANNSNKKEAGFMGYATLNEMPMDVVDENPKRRKISDFDMVYAKACIKKHGTNYKAMEQDIKTNVRQLSENQIRKLCEKCLEFDSA